MVVLSTRLLQLREESKLKQSDLAESIGISRISISNYENGERIPDAEVIFKLAKYFNVSADYLLGLSELRNPESLNPLIEGIFGQHDYPDNIKKIADSLKAYFTTIDSECKKIDAADVNRIIDLYSIMGGIDLVIVREKQNIMVQKENVIKALDLIEKGAIDYIESKAQEIIEKSRKIGK